MPSQQQNNTIKLHHPPTPILHANPLHARWSALKPSPTHPITVPTQIDNKHNIKHSNDRPTSRIEIQ